MKYLTNLLLLIVSTQSIAFETSGWEGEGIPVMSFKSHTAVFCKTSKVDETCIQKKTIQNIKMAYDNGKYIKNSKLITTKSITMKALNDFTIKDYNLSVKKGSELINVQYRAEGYYLILVNGKPYEIDPYAYQNNLTNYDKSPFTEAWVNIVGKGWLKLPNNSVIFHDREF